MLRGFVSLLLLKFKKELMNKLILIFVFLVTICAQGFAQQEAQFTQFMHNKLYYNPAYAGARGVASLKAIYRHQWIGFEGSPKSRLLSFDIPLFNDQVGFGVTFLSRDQGITTNWESSMAYSYSIKLKEDLQLRVGFQGSIRYYGINFDDPEFMILERNDPSIMDGMQADNYYGNFGFGAYLVHEKYFAGLSIPNFYGNDIGFSPEGYEDFAKEVKHFYAMGGVNLKVADNLVLRPSLLLKYAKNAPFDVETNVNLTIDNQVTVGLSYRAGGDGAGESIDLLAMYQLNKLAFGIAYDVSISPLRSHSSGSFEVLVRYDFSGARTDIANPRFFY